MIAEPHQKTADLYDPFDMTDPFPFYEYARANDPVFWNEKLGCWVVTRHEDVKTVFKDLALFSSRNTGSSVSSHSPAVQKVLDDGGMTITSGMSGRMPPSHTRIRSFINKAFTPRRTKKMEAPIRARVIELLDEFKNGRADLVKQLTYDLPALVVFMLLGVPDEDVADVKRWALARMAFQWGNPTEEEKIEHAKDMVKYWQYCLSLIDQRFEELRDDLPSDLVRIYNAGDKTITREEMAAVCYTMLFAGHETTSNVLAEGIRLMLTHRHSWAAVCADASLIPRAVDEMLRYTPSIFAWRRITTEPVTLGGVDLPADAPLVVVIGSANHDGACFANSETFDIMRDDTKEMLTFGHGVKYCLGAPLARLEGRVVVEELSKRFPSLRLAKNQTITYRPNSAMRGPEQVIVEWDEEEG
ncbi:MAG: cytochrome P450 [Chloroflexota bacterium]